MFEQSPVTCHGTPLTGTCAGMLAAIAIGLGSCASEPPQPTPPPAESPVTESPAVEENVEVATEGEDRRQLDAHLHGAATLNVAVEDNSLYVELTSPAIDIVGFEHQPKSDEQKAAVSQAIATLEAGTELFALPDAAGCRLTEASVATELSDRHDEHEEHSGHEEHGEHGHGEHEEEAHASEEEGEVHSEFMATYRFECAQPQQLQQINTNLFSTFPTLEEIEARVLTDSGQTAAELTPTQSSLSL